MFLFEAPPYHIPRLLALLRARGAEDVGDLGAHAADLAYALGLEHVLELHPARLLGLGELVRLLHRRLDLLHHLLGDLRRTGRDGIRHVLLLQAPPGRS